MKIDGRVDISALSSDKQQRLKGAQNTDQALEILAADGQIDAQEQAVLEEIQAETEAEDSDGTVLFESAEFEATGLQFGKGNLLEQAQKKAQAVVKQADQTATQSTFKRVQRFRQIENSDQLKVVLEADQRIAGSNADGKKTTYGTSSVAGKILMQDAILAQSVGALNPEQAAFVDQLADKVRNGGIDKLSKEDVQQLDQIVENVLSQLDGESGLQFHRPDLAALGQIDQQALQTTDYDLAHANLESTLDQADAAINDIKLATHETGLSLNLLKEQKAKGWTANNVQLGRSFVRMADSLDEAKKQLDVINTTLLPTLKAQVDDLDKRIADRTSSLQAENKTPEEIEADQQLQLLRTQRTGVVGKYAALNERAKELASTRVEGLKTMKSVQVITSEMQDRVAAVNEQIDNLWIGSQELEELKQRVDQGLEQKPNESRVDFLKRQQDDLKSVAGQLETVHDTLVGGMEGLVQKYKQSKTANPQSIALLEKELQTLKALRNAPWDSQNPAGRIEQLRQARESMVQALQALVPSHVSLEEFRALRDLDKGVTQYGGQRLSTVKSTAESQKAVQEQLTRAIEEEKDITAAGDNALEEMLEMEKGGSGVSLAFGSGATVSLGLSGGIGGSIGSGKIAKLSAKIGVGVEAALTVQKAYGKGPSYIPGEAAYLAYIDLKAKIEGELSLETFLGDIGVEFDASVGWRGGLAFGSLDEARGFGQQLVKTIALAQLLPDGEDEFDAAKNELKRQFDKYKYSGTTKELGVSGKIGKGEGADFTGLGGSYRTSTETMTYSDGTTIQDETTTGSVSVGLGKGRSAKFTYTDLTSSNITKGSDNKPATMKSVSVAVPLQTMTQIADYMSKGGTKPFSELVNKMGDSFKTSFLNHFKAMNPESVALSAAAIIAAMDSAISGNPNLFNEMISTAKYTSSGGSEIVLGVGRRENPSADPPENRPKWNLSFGIQGNYEVSAEASSGVFYGKMKAGLSYKLAGSVALPIQE